MQSYRKVPARHHTHHSFWSWMCLLLLTTGLVACAAPKRYMRPNRVSRHAGQNQTVSVQRRGHYRRHRAHPRVRNAAPATPRRRAQRPGNHRGARNRYKAQIARKLGPLVAVKPIQEADLYRIKGRYLYYLHTYRGLTVFDLGDPNHPTRVASLPVYGTPVEMFVEQDKAYILVNDAMRLVQEQGRLKFQQLHQSLLVSVDLSHPNHPEVLDKISIQGRLREGLARKRGDVIYVVSHQQNLNRWTWSRNRYGHRYRRYRRTPEKLLAHSYDITSANQIKHVHSLPLLQSKRTYQTRHKQAYEQHRYLNRFIITATSNKLMVAEHWYRYSTNYYRRGLFRRRCYERENTPYSRVSVVDISDDKGQMRRHTTFSIDGHLTDQFKQTHYVDAAHRQLYLGVTLLRYSRYSNCGGSRSGVKNLLLTVDISKGSAPELLAALPFGKPRETVRGSLFDVHRRVLYAITAVRRDPLYAISFANPSKPKVLSQIDGLSGDIHLFRLVNQGRVLLAVGRDNSRSCRGFGRGRWRSSVAVSLFDIRDLHNVRLIQRRCVELRYARNTYSNINNNRDQAHKMIGMHSDGDLNLLTIPFYFQNSYRYRRYGYHSSAISVMRWDLSQYDPQRSHARQDVLHSLGSFIHPHERLKRTIIASVLQSNGKQRRLAINLSANYLSVVDLHHLQKPKFLASLSISPVTQGVYRFGKYLAEQVVERSYRRRTIHKLLIRRLNRKQQTGRIIRTLSLGEAQQVFQWKKMLVVIRYPIREHKVGKTYKSYVYRNANEVALYDFRDPTHPRFRGRTELSFRLPMLPQSSCNGCGKSATSVSHLRYGHPHARQWIKTSRGMALIYTGPSTQFGRRFHSSQMLLLDFRRPSRPSYQTYPLPYGGIRGLVKVNEQQFFVVQQRNHRQGLAFVQRWYQDGDKWDRDHWMPAPGHPTHAYLQQGELHLLTHNQQLAELHISRYERSTSKLTMLSRLPVRPTSYVMYNRHLYLTHIRSGWNHLAVYKLQGKNLKKLRDVPVMKQHIRLLYVRSRQVVLTTYRGLLALRNDLAPQINGFAYRGFSPQAPWNINAGVQLAALSRAVVVAGQRLGLFYLPIPQKPNQVLMPLTQERHQKPKGEIKPTSLEKTRPRLSMK